MFEVEVPKILIYGASSQVGSSVALFLSRKKLASCTCLIRNANSSIFFEINEIPFHITTKLSGEELRGLVQSHDAVLDFTYPSGQANTILSAIKENMRHIIKQMNAKQPYFHMSSIMAYGFPDGNKNLKHYHIPRTSYGYIKRNAELAAKKLGAKYNVPIYNFRLGQVHGFLQSVNASYRSKLCSNANIYLDGKANDSVNIIFIHSLSYAILDCIGYKYQPGLYTLVNEPQWSLQELYEYYTNTYKIDSNIIYQPQLIARKTNNIKQSILGLTKKYRQILETYVLFKLPFLYKRVKGKFRQVNVGKMQNQIDYTDFHILGKPSSAIIPTKFSNLNEVTRIEKEMEKLYASAIENHVHG